MSIFYCFFGTNAYSLGDIKTQNNILKSFEIHYSGEINCQNMPTCV